MFQTRGLPKAEDFSPSARASAAEGLDGRRPKFLEYQYETQTLNRFVSCWKLTWSPIITYYTKSPTWSAHGNPLLCATKQSKKKEWKKRSNKNYYKLNFKQSSMTSPQSSFVVVSFSWAAFTGRFAAFSLLTKPLNCDARWLTWRAAAAPRRPSIHTVSR